MTAQTAHRIFLSAVTAEYARYRAELAMRFRAVSVDPVFQEEFEYADCDLIEKLYQLIKPCNVVIHFYGAGAGSIANPKAVEDFLQKCESRGEDFLGFWKTNYALDRAFFDQLSYTQWEAVIAVFLAKKFMALKPTAPVTDGHPVDKPPFAATVADAESQARHLQWLNQTIRRYPQEITATGGSYLEDAFHKILGFLLRECPNLISAAQQLQTNYPVQKIAESKLVARHTTDFLYGRDEELKLLDDAWAAQDQVNVQCVIAWGGVGKTALLAHWVQTRFRDRGWRDEQGRPEPLRYFDWTFYDQGTRSSDATQAGAASIGTFFVEALKHFGDPVPDKPDNKAQRLATLVQAQRSLIVLDGLEPLQYPHNHPQAGQITDPDLAQFLRLLAQKNPGLCLISSREVLSELTGHLAANVPQKELDDLSREAAISLLRKLQVIGSDDDLAQAAIDYQHHALSLILLGRFLFTARGGDIRQRDTVKFKKLDDKRAAQTRSAWHVLETYERWLQSPEGNPVDLQALRLVGLFDRPARSDCLDALRAAPSIPGLTDLLVPLDNDDWNAVLGRLNEAHLIQLKFPPREPNSQAPFLQARTVPVDAHPLIREYFAEQLRKLGLTGQSESDAHRLEAYATPFQIAHSRLFDHLCESTEHQPDTLDGLQPLYQAVVHGCLAERQQEACDKVYYGRILRGTGHDGFYSRRKLGAIGEDLGAIAAFFVEPWTRLSPNLSEPDQAWLLNEAALGLRALGRLTEALEPMRVSGEMDVKVEGWKGAAASYSNLSELEVTLGRLGEAVADARSAIDFADRSGDTFLRMGFRTTAADALHQLGSWKGEVGSLKVRDAGGVDPVTEARQLFEQAETLQRDDQPTFDLLYSLQGFRYCELILAVAERAAWHSQPLETPNLKSEISAALAEAELRGTRALEIVMNGSRNLLDIALNHLTLSRVALYRAVLSAQSPAVDANPHLAPALDGLRYSNNLDELPKALLTAAHWHALIGDADTARRHLDEAQQIAERGPMPLFLADVHLHRARIFGSLKREVRNLKYADIDPHAELAAAKSLIEKHHYGRRSQELADAEAAAVHW